MGETLPKGSETALVNRLRGRGRPRKVNQQQLVKDLQPTQSDEDISGKDELSDESISMAEEIETETELSHGSNIENSPPPAARSMNVSRTPNVSH